MSAILSTPEIQTVSSPTISLTERVNVESMFSAFRKFSISFMYKEYEFVQMKIKGSI